MPIKKFDEFVNESFGDEDAVEMVNLAKHRNTREEFEKRLAGAGTKLLKDIMYYAQEIPMEKGKASMIAKKVIAEALPVNYSDISVDLEVRGEAKEVAKKFIGPWDEFARAFENLDPKDQYNVCQWLVATQPEKEITRVMARILDVIL